MFLQLVTLCTIGRVTSRIKLAEVVCPYSRNKTVKLEPKTQPDSLVSGQKVQILLKNSNLFLDFFLVPHNLLVSQLIFPMVDLVICHAAFE